MEIPTKKISFVEEKVADLTRDVIRLKTTVADAVEDGLMASRRVLKRGYRTAEDLVGEMEHYVKQHPLRSVTIALGTGALVGWLVSRNGKR